MILRKLIVICAFTSFFFVLTSHSSADALKPVAIRFWGQSMISIETFWNLTVVIDPFDPDMTGVDNPEIHGDIVLVTHRDGDHSNVDMIKGNPAVVHGLNSDGQIMKTDIIFERLPNEDRPKISAYNETKIYSEHAIRIQSIDSYHDNEKGAKRGNNVMFLIEVNGIKILHAGDLGQLELTSRQLNKIGKIDVLMLPVGGVYTIDGVQAVGIIEQLSPHMVVPMHYKFGPLKIDLNTIEPFLEKCPGKYERVKTNGNTFAVRKGQISSFAKPKLLLLKHKPWEMPKQLKALFHRKEHSARSCIPIYSNLSINQLNHKPSNRTHTVRWNIDHLTGRELLFFSQVYSSLDSMVPKLDQNPKQMPPDYVPQRPEWTGMEEAKHIERTLAFSRRFAYLLHDIDMDKKFRLSRFEDGETHEFYWNMSELCGRMEEHYAYHTEHVKRKFELPDWPTE